MSLVSKCTFFTGFDRLVLGILIVVEVDRSDVGGAIETWDDVTVVVVDVDGVSMREVTFNDVDKSEVGGAIVNIVDKSEVGGIIDELVDRSAVGGDVFVTVLVGGVVGGVAVVEGIVGKETCFCFRNGRSSGLRLLADDGIYCDPD